MGRGESHRWREYDSDWGCLPGNFIHECCHRRSEIDRYIVRHCDIVLSAAKSRLWSRNAVEPVYRFFTQFQRRWQMATTWKKRRSQQQRRRHRPQNSCRDFFQISDRNLFSQLSRFEIFLFPFCAHFLHLAHVIKIHGWFQEVQQKKIEVAKQNNVTEGIQSKQLRDKLMELETEIEKFRSENAALTKLRTEREEVRFYKSRLFHSQRTTGILMQEVSKRWIVFFLLWKGLAKLHKEMLEFEKQKEAELKRLNDFKTEETKKLKWVVLAPMIGRLLMLYENASFLIWLILCEVNCLCCCFNQKRKEALRPISEGSKSHSGQKGAWGNGKPQETGAARLRHQKSNDSFHTSQSCQECCLWWGKEQDLRFSSKVTDLQDELKRKEQRWTSSTTRLRDRIETLENENKELKEEVRILEKKRLEAWQQRDTEKKSSAVASNLAFKASRCLVTLRCGKKISIFSPDEKRHLEFHQLTCYCRKKIRGKVLWRQLRNNSQINFWRVTILFSSAPTLRTWKLHWVGREFIYDIPRSKLSQTAGDCTHQENRCHSIFQIICLLLHSLTHVCWFILQKKRWIRHRMKEKLTIIVSHWRRKSPLLC